MSKKFCFALIFFLLFHSPANQAGNAFSASLLCRQTVAKQAATPAEELQRLRAGVQAKLDELYKNAEFPGATVGFILADGRFTSVSTGLSNLENKTPLQPTDKMLAGSIGKTYFAAVVMQLVQEGKLNLDEKINKWFGR